MRLLRRVAALAALLALTWVFAPVAAAGGPTSVFLVSPESGETASLYYADKEYGTLTDLLGPTGSDGSKERPPSLDMAMGTRQITVTWMVHDVDPWRVDRLYPGDERDTVWIHTSTESGGEQGTWHTAQRPGKLIELLGGLGLMGEKSPSGGGGGDYPPPWEQDAGATEEAPAGPAGGPPGEDRPRPTAAASTSTTGWWWSIPGLAAGAVLALFLRPLLPSFPFRRGAGDPGPRQELLDAP
ncbi:hypothetical protein ACH46N_21230 [Streptomyces pristinaespiralis]|nr:hypothetical protein [Streptomyces pristinaespiralis]ALC21354.1 hypothetical protein SPRI_3048 [Streptomyces pristinaespiralis]QMU15917.1 hypothetical protein H3L99_21790 [Streptomyces pristinaespiralis]